MVSPHLKINSGSRSAGKSGVEHFRYICREGKYQKREDKVSITHQNYPAWAKDSPQKFWEAADIYERANARIYTEFEIALPRELTQAQQTRLIREFVQQELGDKHPYTIAFHCSPSLDGGVNPHVHLMFSERALDGVERDEKQFFKRANSRHPERGGAAKNRDWSRRNKVKEFRNSWENAINLAFQRAGIDKVISLKSLKEQGIDREPEPKLGARQASMLREGKDNENTRLVKALREVRQLETSLAKIHSEITETINDLARESVSKSPLNIPAHEIKAAVREHKMGLYARLRKVEGDRYSLGLLHTAQGGVYSKSTDSSIKQRRVKADRQYEQLTGDILGAKKFEKNLALLGSMEVSVKQGKPLLNVECLYDRQGFLQKVEQAQVQILERSKNQQIQLIREVPPP